MHPRPVDKQSGIALVTVLWLLALLSLIAASYTAASRSEIHMTAGSLQRAEARALAEAGIWRGVAELLKPASVRNWNTSGIANSFHFEEHLIQVRIEDEAGKIDLNAARAELIGGLLLTTGIEANRREALLEAIIGWRSNGSQTRTGGLKHGPFNSTDELLQIPGMDYQLYETIAPALTVYSHQPGVNPETASAIALRALPGATPGNVSAYLQQRRTTGTQATLDSVHPRFISRTHGSNYTLTSTAAVGRARANLKVVLALRADGESPYTVLAWQTDMNTTDPAEGI